ncbi:MAG: hypothetical protein N3A61_01870, partial [Ignavibacteria bacterium]|nr:hypothetical protein [Ignavibacteria bacterium]
DYTAEKFFDEVMFPLFFNDQRHLMHVTNSPFFQKVTDNDIKIFGTKTSAQYSNFKEKIKKGEYGGDMLVGYGSIDPSATTSGQLSDLKININSEEVYYSWIGQALAISVKGGISILIDKKEILLLLCKGWEDYSLFIDQTPNLKDKQIETWNGNYLIQMLNNPEKKFNFQKVEIEMSSKKLAIQTIEWTKLIFELCKFFKNETIYFYAYVLSQTNTTIGMITAFLKEINEMYELRDLIFIDEKATILSDAQIEKLIPFYSFKQACMRGTIGLKSIEPDGLRKYIPKGSFKFSQGNEIEIQKETNFFIYKLWIMAMLNKKELLDLSREFAAVLRKAVNEMRSEGRSKTTDRQYIKELFDCKSPIQFIDRITELIDASNSEMLRQLVEEVVLMPKDNFPLFLTLIKFEYSILSQKEDK